MSHSPYGPAAPEYAAAFDSVRLAKSLCLLAIFLALAVEVTAFALVRFGGVLNAVETRSTGVIAGSREPAPADEPNEATTLPAATSPATAPATEAAPEASGSPAAPAEDHSEEVGNAVVWKSVLTWLLHAGKLLTPLLALLLIFVLTLAVNFSLLGRLGGAAGLTSALLWAIVLLLLVSPWQLMLRGGLACGAMYDMNELIAHTRRILPEWGAQDVRLELPTVYYVRFLGLPIVALIVWLAVLLKFSRGRRQMAFPVGVTSIPPAAPPRPPQTYSPAEDSQPTP